MATITTGGRSYPFVPYGGLGGTFLRINDTTAPWLNNLARTFPSEFNRALRHVGWWMRGELKEAAISGNVAGTAWPPLSDIHKRRVLDWAKATLWGHKPPGPALHPFGKVVNAIAYRHEKLGMRVRIGFMGSSAAKWAVKVQTGFKTPVTAKMRALFWGAGLFAPGGSHITAPPRPLIYPMYRAKEKEIIKRMEQRIFDHVRKSSPARLAA